MTDSSKESANNVCLQEEEEEIASSPSPSSSFLLSSSPTPFQKASPTTRKEDEENSDKEATFTGEILGATESGEGRDKKEEKKTEKKSETGLLDKIPFLLIPGGVILLFFANFQTLKPKIQDIIDLIKYRSRD